LGFIRKVFGLLYFQLGITTLLVIIAMNSLSFQKFQIKNLVFFIYTLILIIIVMIALMCYKELAKKVPTNFRKSKIIHIFDDIFTFCEIYMVFLIIVGFFRMFRFRVELVLIPAVMTLGITAILTFNALTTKTNFKIIGVSLFIFGMALMLFGIIVALFQGRVMYGVYFSF
jgi:protein lifeguard